MRRSSSTGPDAGEVDGLRARLAEVGFDDVRAYEEWVAWAADERLPVERLPNYERLVHPEWLRDVLDGGGRKPRLWDATSCST